MSTLSDMPKGSIGNHDFDNLTSTPQGLHMQRMRLSLSVSRVYLVIFKSVSSLTIISRARMGSESIAHEAEGRMGYIDAEAIRARGIIIVLVKSN